MPKSKPKVKVHPEQLPSPAKEVLSAPTLEDQHRVLFWGHQQTVEPKAQAPVMYLTRTFTTYSAYEDPV